MVPQARQPSRSGAGTERARALDAAAGVFAGFALLALLDACATAVSVPYPAEDPRLRLARQILDMAETLGLGALAGLAVGGFVRITRLGPWRTGCAEGTAAMAVAYAVIGWRLVRFASHALDGRLVSAVLLGYYAAIGVGVPALLWAARALGRRRYARAVPVAVAVCVIVADQRTLPDDYPDMHGVVALGALLVAGAGVATLAGHAARALAATPRGRGVVAAAVILALFGVGWPPSNATRLELFRQPCSIAPWVLASTLWRAPQPHAPAAPTPSAWMADRLKAPPAPPTVPELLRPDAVVVLVTIDALRADVVNGEANDARFPTFARLRRQSVVFTHTSSSGAETAVSLSALFSGVYYSEQTWTDYGAGRLRALFPADDASPRFPQLLSDHGVSTVSYAGISALGGGYGIIRGFREEGPAAPGWSHTRASDIAAPLVARLERRDPGPLFFYAHFLDAHRPYDGAPKDGDDYAHYLSAVASIDAALGRIVHYLTVGFDNRWALFVTADHGEAFGEHGTTEHAKTLYEELVHVPLFARSPSFPARVVADRVGLIDLAPTILDLFGVETPATFEGQSLVPLLAGGSARFSRQLMAEGRLRRAITQADGFKVIDDPRRKVVEAYDLAADPGETRNVFDAEPARSDRALETLRAFFAVHARREGGYEPPYRP